MRPSVAVMALAALLAPWDALQGASSAQPDRIPVIAPEGAVGDLGQRGGPVIHTAQVEVQEQGGGVVLLPQSPAVPSRVEVRAGYSMEWMDMITAGATPATVVASWDVAGQGGLPSAGDYGTFGDTFVELTAEVAGLTGYAQVRRIVQGGTVAPGQTAVMQYDAGAFIGADSTTEAKAISSFVGTGDVEISYEFGSEDYLAGGSNASIIRSTSAFASVTVIYYFD